MRHEPPTTIPNNSKAGRLTRVLNAYPPLAAIDDPGWPEIIDHARGVRMPAGTALLARHARNEHFMLLLDGSVRVYQLGEDGREITLYRVGPGDICMMSLASLIRNQPFNACAEAETDVDALLLSRADYQRAMACSAAFRDWVVASLTGRFCQMLETFHETVFDSLAIRLACLLGRLFERADDDTLQVTHQQLACELGTSREVVSRTLKAFERHGCIVLARGQIRIAPGQRLPLDIW